MWEIPDGVDYEDAAVLDPICMPINPSRSNRNSFQVRMWSSRHWPTRAILRTNGADYGGGNIVVVGLQEDVAVRFPVAKEWVRRQ